MAKKHHLLFEWPFKKKIQIHSYLMNKGWKALYCIFLCPGPDAINISGLLNPKKLGNFKNQML